MTNVEDFISTSNLYYRWSDWRFYWFRTRAGLEIATDAD